MSKVFVISDLHLGHESMAVKRGFSSSKEHDQFIIDKWNSTVNKRDTVWILGDISMEKPEPYKKLVLMNGVKNVVLGNHDLPQHVEYLKIYGLVNKISGFLKKSGFALTHCPIHESEIDRFKANIHGHVHEKSLSDTRYINVSCEAVDYTPIEFLKLTQTIWK